MSKLRYSVRLDPKDEAAIKRIYGGLGVFVRASYRLACYIPYFRNKIKAEILKEVNICQKRTG